MGPAGTPSPPLTDAEEQTRLFQAEVLETSNVAWHRAREERKQAEHAAKNKRETTNLAEANKKLEKQVQKLMQDGPTHMRSELEHLKQNGPVHLRMQLLEKTNALEQLQADRQSSTALLADNQVKLSQAADRHAEQEQQLKDLHDK